MAPPLQDLGRGFPRESPRKALFALWDRADHRAQWALSGALEAAPLLRFPPCDQKGECRARGLTSGVG